MKRYIRYLMYLAILSSLNLYGEDVCSLKQRPMTDSYYLKLAELNDYIGFSYNLPKAPSCAGLFSKECQTSFGAVLDESCFKNKSKDEIKKIVNIFERGAEYLAKKAKGCQENIGFRELDSVIPILRRTTIDCENLGNALAHNHMTRSVFNASYFQSFSFSFDNKYLNDMIETQNGYKGIGQTLFHESLHSLALNNLNVVRHGSVYKNQNANECNSDLNNDAVFFIENICFENSKANPFPIIDKCPDLCKNVLLGETLNPDPKYAFGQTLGFINYAEGDADIICGRLKNYAKLKDKKVADDILSNFETIRDDIKKVIAENNLEIKANFNKYNNADDYKTSKEIEKIIGNSDEKIDELALALDMFPPLSSSDKNASSFGGNVKVQLSIYKKYLKKNCVSKKQSCDIENDKIVKKYNSLIRMFESRPISLIEKFLSD